MLILRLVVVEVARVRRAAQMRDNWAVDFAVVQAVPVDVFEPRVRFDARGAAADVAEALGGVDGAEARDEVAGVGGHGGGEADFAFDDSGRCEWG